MVVAEIVVGYLIAWALRKARRVGTRLDGEVDQVLDVGLDRLHEVVAGKLGADPALARLREEAANTGEVSDLTRQRVQLSVQAVSEDEAFAARLRGVVENLAATGSAGAVLAAGQRAATVGGSVDIRAERGSAAALTMGDVTLGVPLVDPRRPGRSGD